VQYVDARDLAAFAIETTLNGAVNALSRPGHTTLDQVLELSREVTGSSASFTWVDAEFLLANNVEPWTELPIWVPPIGDMASFYRCDSSLALRSGLICRPARDTVQDTWSWLRDDPDWQQVVSANRSRVGMTTEREAALLAAWRISRRLPGSAAVAGRPVRRSGSRTARRGCGSRLREWPRSPAARARAHPAGVPG